MYGEITKIISGGSYELADLLRRIDVLYASGRLTEDERASLIEAAREGADPEQSMAPVLSRVEALEEWRVEVDARLAALGGGEGGGEADPEPSDEWPEYVQPTGAHDAYHVGDKITWDGRHWVCKMDGCVWTPGDYPAGWELVEGEGE